MEGWQTFIKNNIKNKAGLTDEAIVLLIKDFTCLTAINPDLMSRILQYILDGEDPNILAELEILDIFFKAPHFAPRLKADTSRSPLFKKKSEESEEFLHRLGKVYHALMNPLNPNHLMPQRLKSPSWLEALLLFSSSSYNGDLKTYIQLKIIEKILLAAEKGPDRMVYYIFLEDPTDFSNCRVIMAFFSLTGFTDSVIKHIDFVRQALVNADNDTKFRALRNITVLSLPRESLIPEITQCTIASQKKIRSAAIKILKAYSQKAIPLLKDLITNRDNGEKVHAIKAYHSLSPGDSKKYLKKIIKSERNDKIIEVISGILKE